jgi:hypothetical protein
VGALSLKAKRPRREADHSPPSKAEVKNARRYASIPPYAFMAWYVVKPRDNFYISPKYSAPFVMFYRRCWHYYYYYY